MAGTTLRAHNVKGQENLDNLLKPEVYATMVHEFKCLYAHGYLCQAHLDFLKQWKATRIKQISQFYMFLSTGFSKCEEPRRIRKI